MSGWRPAEADWCKAVQLVQVEEKERVEKFRYQVDMMSSLVGRLMLRGLVIQKLGVDNFKVRMSRTERGKPVVEGGCDGWDYNVSHAGDWVVLAANKGIVGVDVMKLVDSRGDRVDEFFRLMKKQFTDKEWETIRGSEDDADEEKLSRFFRHWALKESYVKAVGTGLNLDLRTLNFTLGSDKLQGGHVESKTKLSIECRNDVQWRFEESLIDANHVCSVAIESDESDESDILCGEGFKVLDIHDIFELFNNGYASANYMTREDDPDNHDIVTAEPLLRPVDPADYALFCSKVHPKPF